MVGHQNITSRQVSWQLKLVLLLIFKEDEYGISFPPHPGMFFPKEKLQTKFTRLRAKPILSHDPSPSKCNVYAWFRRHIFITFLFGFTLSSFQQRLRNNKYFLARLSSREHKNLSQETPFAQFFTLLVKLLGGVLTLWPFQVSF